MDSSTAKSEFTLALTQAALGKIPPELHVAIGHDDAVMLFLLRVSDPDATTQVLMGAITLSETNSIVEALKTTRGLIQKRFQIDDAFRIKDQLVSVGTDVEFIRPNELVPE
jgi:hypothetical protein